MSGGPRCGAQDWAYDDNDEPFIYGTCEKPKDHEDRWHTQWMPSGRIWAEWSGPSDERAPEGARDGFLGLGPDDPEQAWRDRALALVGDTQTRLDAERRHGAVLEARLLRHAPTWEVEA